MSTSSSSPPRWVRLRIGQPRRLGVWVLIDDVGRILAWVLRPTPVSFLPFSAPYSGPRAAGLNLIADGRRVGPPYPTLGLAQSRAETAAGIRARETH